MTDNTIELLTAKLNELETNYTNLIQVLVSNNIDFDLPSSSTKPKKKKDKTTDKTTKTTITTDKPKKNPSGYIIFSKENRDKAKQTLSHEQPDFKNSDVMVMLGKMWKQLDPDTQALYNDKAKNI